MFGLTPIPMYAVYAIIFLALSNIGTFLAWQSADSRADKYKAEVVVCAAQHEAFVAQTKAQGRIAAEKTKQENLKNEHISESTVSGWAAALGVVRADRDHLGKRVRDAEARRSAGGSGVSAPTQDRPGNTEAGSDAVPSPATVAADCAETTITLNYLQSYVERLEGASP